MDSSQGNSQTQQPHSNSLLDIPDTCADRAPVSSLLFGNSSKQSDPDSCDRKTFRVEPPSNLLSRLNNFLPQIAKANKELKAAVASDPSKVDIENVSPDSTQYIEMDLGLGVFDMKPKKDTSHKNDVVISTNGNSNNTDSDSSDEEANVRQSRVVIDPSLIAGRQKSKPNIEVLNMDDSSDSCLSDSSSDSDQMMKL
ncbi:hypothetical protein H4S08_000434 [Coemansia sp. RSA 1365]|nr:hypothetical protein H4S08_000434 [Coemansia sp. RSA 1365]